MNYQFSRSTFQRVKDLFTGKRRSKKARLPIAGGRRGAGAGDFPEEEANAFIYDGQIVYVISSSVMVAQYLYDEEVLVVEFIRRKRRPAAYAYFDVSVNDAIFFLQHASKGRAVWERFRASRYGSGKRFSRLN